MHRIVVLAAGAITTGVMVLGRRRKQRGTTSSPLSTQQRPGKQQRQIVHAFSSTSAAPSESDAAAANQAANAASGDSRCTISTRLQPSLSYAFSSLLLLLSLAVAAYTVVVLLLRGQPDLAAAAALTWLLAAPVVLAIGRQPAPAAAAATAAGPSTQAQEDADVTMEIADLEPPTKVLADFHGTWIKDAAASDSMDAAMRLIHLNPVMRQAVKLIKGVQLGIEEERFRFAVFSAISWFKLSEFYPWSGEVCENRRRDMRRGRSQGRTSITPKGTIKLHYTWEHPHSGTATDEFSIDEQDRLRLHTVVHVGEGSASYTQVYRRKGRSSSGGGTGAR